MAEECNVRSVVTCSDPLQYATISAAPEWKALGERLGKAMGSLPKDIKAMSLEDINRFEAGEEVVVGGKKLQPGDLKVCIFLTFQGIFGVAR